MEKAANPFHGSWWAQALHNRLIALVLAMVILVPLFAAPADHALNGMAALAFETGAIVLFMLMVWKSRLPIKREDLTTFLRTGANLPILLFLALAAVSCLFSPQQLFSSQELLKLIAGVVLYFVAAYQFRQSKHLSMLADVLVLLSLLMSLGGLAQYQLNGEDRAKAIFGDPQPLGSFLMFLLPIIAVLAIGDKNAKRQLASQITLVLMIGCLLLTQGRSAWLGGLAGLLTLGVLSFKLPANKERSHLPLRARKHLFVLPAMLIAITVGFFLLMNSQNQSVAQRASTVTHLATDNSWQSRVQEHWTGAVAMIQAKPLTGWGIGLFPIYQHAYTGQGVEIKEGGYRISLAEQAHNFYLQTAAELGLPGLLLMIAVILTFLISGIKRVDRMDAGIRHTLLMGGMASVVAFGVDAFSSPSWQFGQLSMFFWLVMGMGTSCFRPRPKNRRKESVSIDINAAISAPRRVSRFAAVGVCLTLLTLLPTALVSAASDSYNGLCSRQCFIDFKSCQSSCSGLTGSARGQCLSACSVTYRSCRTGCGATDGDNNAGKVVFGGLLLGLMADYLFGNSSGDGNYGGESGT